MYSIKTKYTDDNLLVAVSQNITNDEELDKTAFFNDISIDTDKLIYMYQTHSSNVMLIDNNNRHKYSFKKQIPVKNTDALITNIKNTPLLVRTADCLPVVLYSNETKSIAVIHAGWRGIVSNIIQKTIELMMNTYSVKPPDIYAYLGPRIAIDDYEVGSEVADLFTKKKIHNDTWYVDIGAEAIEQMLIAGIKKENIEDSKLSTFGDTRFYSYRMDKNKSGRIFTVAMIKD